MKVFILDYDPKTGKGEFVRKNQTETFDYHAYGDQRWFLGWADLRKGKLYPLTTIVDKIKAFFLKEVF